MTIEITRPEIESLIHQRLQSGAFVDAEDGILRALAAGARIRELCKGLTLGGLTIRELIDGGVCEPVCLRRCWAGRPAAFGMRSGKPQMAADERR